MGPFDRAGDSKTTMTAAAPPKSAHHNPRFGQKIREIPGKTPILGDGIGRRRTNSPRRHPSMGDSAE